MECVGRWASASGSAQPRLIPGLRDVVDLSHGGEPSDHLCALTDEDEVWCWGSNQWRQIRYHRSTYLLFPRARAMAVARALLLVVLTSACDSVAYCAGHRDLCGQHRLRERADLSPKPLSQAPNSLQPRWDRAAQRAM